MTTRTVRNLAAVLACTTLLSVMGASAASADASTKCDKIAEITSRAAAKQASVAAQNSGHGRSAQALEKRTARVEAKLDRLRARCPG